MVKNYFKLPGITKIYLKKLISGNLFAFYSKIVTVLKSICRHLGKSHSFEDLKVSCWQTLEHNFAFKTSFQKIFQSIAAHESCRLRTLLISLPMTTVTCVRKVSKFKCSKQNMQNLKIKIKTKLSRTLNSFLQTKIALLLYFKGTCFLFVGQKGPHFFKQNCS